MLYLGNMTTAEKIILQLISKKVADKTGLNEIKRSVSSRAKKPLPPNMELFRAYRNLVVKKKIKQNETLEKILKTREIRTLSGVAVITVLTKPYPCPGKCIYCPSDARMPKSYLPKEPAAARGLALKFDPYKQVAKRIEMLQINGHNTDKIELIVKGGTWSAYPKNYREWFIKRCFDAANNRASKKLEDAQKINESAENRIIGLTLELRPDSVTPEEMVHLRRLGCTRIEMGVQTIDDKILKLIRRGHNAAETARATALLKNAGFKVDYHLIPALPGVSPKKDLENFEEIFKNPAYRPDMIKIYPCSIIPKTALYSWWKKGKYKPISTKVLIDLIIKMKLAVPRYVRISRIIRDIPGDDIAAGNIVTNLRELIKQKMETRGLKCKCIRCREIGHKKISNFKFQISNLKTFAEKYKTLGGDEYFISIEDPKRETIFAFARLRLPYGQGSTLTILPEIKGAGLIRELHTYGHLVPVEKRLKGASQHLGFGKTLMKEAEKIARKNGYKKMAVISGIGVRAYYRKLGYGLKGTYMVKSI
ncbi:tRNA uridine(34) 5-carboxymethylaminomethyl modification radical SAM/GNAT enzyme Elp3 [Candidatus Parcubacteria bacterium]|nr:tRNA uridine(34) 5-carboxymethylaminomethyl modification radical SAM/GNAT enzyme Elp3 [Patescibacteria group bacterium]MCG2694387.1 tRNA uridine(34) 5-carboxymethylaminomethyl modification radical SAM/GNAT enzyme Elp3 [Candidatus Parcubacteria bacterium]